MAGKRGKRYPRDFKLNAARLVVEGGYSYRKAAERMGVSVGASGAGQDIPCKRRAT